MTNRVFAAAAFIMATVGFGAPVFGQDATTTPTPTPTLTPRHFEFVKGAAWWGAEPGDPRGRQYLTVGCRPMNADLPWGTRHSKVTVHLKIVFPSPDGTYNGGRSWFFSARRGGHVGGKKTCDLRMGIDTVTFALPGPLNAEQWETVMVIARFYGEGQGGSRPTGLNHEGLVMVGPYRWIGYPDSIHGPADAAASADADEFE